jgi:C-terminal processing protease CtpA/Prc
VKLGSQVKGMNIYWTKRRRYGAGHADVAAKKLPAPGTVRMKDLGGGVAALIPISVPAEEAGGEEKAESQAESMPATVAGRPVGWVPTGNDRSTRLAAVSLAWPVFQHFYPYFDVVKTDWDQALPAALAKAAGDPDELAFLDTLRALVAKLKDGHGHVSLASAINPARLPVSFAWAGKDLAVDRATRESGLVPGDVVLEIGGVPIADRVAQESSLVSAATEGWLRSRLLNELTSAPSDFPVAVKVRRRDGSTAVVKIADAGRDRKELEVKRPANGSEVAPGVMYFDLDGATAADWNKALPALEKAKGLVFDLRGYPGDAGQLVIRHLATKNVTSAEWHIPAVTLPDREGFACVRTAGWNLAPKKPHLTQKTAFITGGGAISYAESCMGIIEHYKLGEIVGEPTAGTNGNVNPFTLPGRYSVAWTGMKVLKHGGTQHHGIGIRPTVPCSRTLKGIAEGRDELLERAIEVVTAQ